MKSQRNIVFVLVAFLFAVSCIATDSTNNQPVVKKKFKRNISTITVATTANWPPMEMIDDNNNIIGFDIDFFNSIAQEAGIKAVFKNISWDKIFNGLIDGKYDAVISSITITEKRKKIMSFSEPYIRGGQILVIPKKMNNVKSIQNMKGRKIGIHNVTVGSLIVENKYDFSFIKYSNIDKAFKKLALGDISGVICDAPLAATYSFYKNKYKNMFQVIGEPLTEEYYGIAVRKEDEELLNIINKGIIAVQSKGIDRKLTNKWLRFGIK